MGLYNDAGIVGRFCAIKHTYKNYKFVNKKEAHYVSSKQYEEVLHKFYKMLSYVLITTGAPIKLPARLGEIKMMKKLVTPFMTMVNHRATINEGKKVYWDLTSTNNYKPVCMWRYATFAHRDLVRFDMVRSSIRINTYHKTHAAVRMWEFFQEKGYLIYDTYERYRISKKPFDISKAAGTKKDLTTPNNEDNNART